MKSLSEASKILSIPVPTICYRLKTGKTGYHYIDKDSS